MTDDRLLRHPLTRRSLLAATGGLALTGLLAACGGDNGRGSSGGSGATISQWYHAYGEAGTQQAVERYAKAYDTATVSVVWTPSDYDNKAAAALLTSDGPDVFEYGNGPSIDMIKGKQVVGLGDVLGDAKSDFNAQLVDRMTYEGELYAVPQVIDMQALVYRKSLLAKAGVNPPKTVDELLDAAKRLTNDTTKGLFVGNDGGVGILGGPALWSAGLDYLTDDGKVGFDDPAAATSTGKLHELFTSGALLLGAPSDWSAPDALTQNLTAMQFTGLWNFPAFKEALGDDVGVVAWPALTDSTGDPSVPIGAYGSAVSAKARDVDASKAFVKWLWVDQTKDQLDFAQSYGFHIPARTSLADQADGLKSGAAADAVTLSKENGRAQTPLLWTATSSTTYQDALSRIIKDGADPATELKAVVATVESELKRIGG